MIAWLHLRPVYNPSSRLDQGGHLESLVIACCNCGSKLTCSKSLMMEDAGVRDKRRRSSAVLAGIIHSSVKAKGLIIEGAG